MPVNPLVIRVAKRPSQGWMVIHPNHRERLTSLGFDTPLSLMNLAGEIVSGHPDRHVVRVDHPLWPCGLYLKRQHHVSRRERFMQWRAGFGWTSRCEREACILTNLEQAGFSTPSWVAFGGDGTGREFLLLEEIRDSRDLRNLLSDSELSATQRRTITQKFGQTIAQLHAAGFDTPDLTAKHVFIDSDSLAVTLIDWQNAAQSQPRDHARRLAALHASLPHSLASHHERLRFLAAYRRTSGTPLRINRIVKLAKELTKRRSIRDQRQPVNTSSAQRLVWLADEAVCAVPDVAAVWPVPAVCEPFYGSNTPEGRSLHTLADGREAVLLRGRSWAPFGRLRARMRGRSWRSPGVTLGRVLFHLERYGIPAPRLFAFGQRFTSRTHTEWFALHEAHTISPLNHIASCEYQRLLDRLHRAGCRLELSMGFPFGLVNDHLGITDPCAIRLTRKLTLRQRQADARALARYQTMHACEHTPE